MRLIDYSVRAFVLVVVLALPALAWAGPGPNMPAGTTELASQTFATWNGAVHVQSNGWVNNSPGGNCFIVNDGAEPGSPPGALRQQRNAGALHGSCLPYKTFTPSTRVYGSMTFRLRNPFYGVGSGSHKLTGYIAQQTTGNNTVWTMHGPQPNTNGQGPFQIWLGFNGPANNCHLVGAPNVSIPIPSECNIGAGLTPNVSGASITPGPWQRMEFIMELGTCPTCQNGKAIWFTNGVKTGQHLNFNHANSPWNAWAVTHSWDGQGQQNQAEQTFIDIGDIWIGTYPAGAAIPGGGPIQPPPPSSTAWPNEPTTGAVLTDYPFDHQCASGSGWNCLFPGGGSIVSDSNAGANGSPPNAMRMTHTHLTTGDGGHYPQSSISLPSPSSVWVGFWFKQSNPFWRVNATEPCKQKILLLHNEVGPGQSGSLHTIMHGADGGCAKTSRNVQAQFHYFQEESQNPGISVIEPGLADYPPNTNVASANYAPATWTRIEQCMVVGSSPTSNNGQFRLWKDSALIVNSNSVNYPGAFNFLQMWPGWAGATAGGATPHGSVDWLQYDHMKIRTGFGACPGSSGGGGPIVPPPDTTAPGQVQNFNVVVNN